MRVPAWMKQYPGLALALMAATWVIVLRVALEPSGTRTVIAVVGIWALLAFAARYLWTPRQRAPR